MNKSENKTKNITTNKGFTLVEMMVAIGLFSVVMLVAVAAILSIIGNNKKAQGINNVVNNLNFAVESMVRDLKTGYYYRCGTDTYVVGVNSTADLCGDPVTSQDSVSFVSTLSGIPTPVEYTFVPSSTDASGVYTAGHIVKSTDGGTPIELTSKTDIDIESMEMYIHSPKPASELLPSETPSQPGIFLIIRGKANILGNEVTQFGIQTYISQRILNL